jgi:hypothetical protein
MRRELCTVLGCPVLRGFEPLRAALALPEPFQGLSFWIGPQNGLELALRSFLPTSHAIVTSRLLQLGRPIDLLDPCIELAYMAGDVRSLLTQAPYVERPHVLELRPRGPHEAGLL